jgi:hypothetical protein
MYGLSGSSMRMLRLRGIVLPRWSFTTDNQSAPFKCEQFNASLRLRDSQFNGMSSRSFSCFPGSVGRSGLAKMTSPSLKREARWNCLSPGWQTSVPWNVCFEHRFSMDDTRWLFRFAGNLRQSVHDVLHRFLLCPLLWITPFEQMCLSSASPVSLPVVQNGA